VVLDSGSKNACFGPLKPDFEPPELVYAAMNMPESSFSTASSCLLVNRKA
jgi:hypothetical protein